jgi:hypothetical protein
MQEGDARQHNPQVPAEESAMFACHAAWMSGIALLSTSGCAIPVQGAEGTRHYVVIGIGVVSVPSPPPETAVTAVKIQALGVVATSTPTARLIIGYTKGYQVEAAPHAQSVLLELSDSFAGPLKIRTEQIRTEKLDSQENDQ